MKTRSLFLTGVLIAGLVSAASGEVKLKMVGGRAVITNDGPVKLRASEDWLAARMQKASSYDELIEASAKEWTAPADRVPGGGVA